MKKLLLIFSLFMFLPVLNAEEINYFDWPQVSVDSLPTASSDTTNKVFIFNNKYYITEIETSGGYTPIPLNQSLKDLKIYFDYNNLSNLSTYCQTLAISQSRWFVGNNIDGQFDYTRYNSSCTSSQFYVYYARVVYTNGAIYCMESNGSYCSDTTLRTNGAQLYNAPNNRKAEYFMFKNDVTITGVYAYGDTYYKMFSLTPFDVTTIYTWLEVNVSQVIPIVENKIYVPSNNLTCYHFTSNGLLRGYLGTPVVNEDITYYDFDIHNHYNSVKGVEFITDNPVCLSNTTTNYLYRNDIVEVLIYFLIVGFFVIYIPFKILMTFFKRRI